jgi:hypothetical protein
VSDTARDEALGDTLIRQIGASHVMLVLDNRDHLLRGVRRGEPPATKNTRSVSSEIRTLRNER